MKHIHQIAIAIISIFTLLSCSSDSTTYYTLSVIPSPAEGGTVTPSSGEFVKGEEVEIMFEKNKQKEAIFYNAYRHFKPNDRKKIIEDEIGGKIGRVPLHRPSIRSADAMSSRFEEALEDH